MRRILSLICSVIILSFTNQTMATATASYGDSSDFIKIYDKQDLWDFCNSMSGNYMLMNDIVFTEADYGSNSSEVWRNGWLPSKHTYSGVFYGNGHTISGLKIRTDSASLENSQYLSFIHINKGTIDGLILSDISYTNKQTKPGPDYCGIFTAVNEGVINDCSYIQDRSVRLFPYGEHFGVMAGVNRGEIANCNNNVLISAGFYENEQLVLGGIAGENYGTISNCDNNADIYATTVTTTQVTLNNTICIVGGIAGSNAGLISQCCNEGQITSQASNITGIAICGSISGQLTRSVANGEIIYQGVVLDCISTGDVIANGKSTIKGNICGSVSGSVKCCFFAGESPFGTVHSNSEIAACYDLDDCDQLTLDRLNDFDFINIWGCDLNNSYKPDFQRRLRDYISFNDTGIKVSKQSGPFGRVILAGYNYSNRMLYTTILYNNTFTQYNSGSDSELTIIKVFFLDYDFIPLMEPAVYLCS